MRDWYISKFGRPDRPGRHLGLNETYVLEMALTPLGSEWFREPLYTEHGLFTVRHAASLTILLQSIVVRLFAQISST
jgi:hypothetical protein